MYVYKSHIIKTKGTFDFITLQALISSDLFHTSYTHIYVYIYGAELFTIVCTYICMYSYTLTAYNFLMIIFIFNRLFLFKAK